MLGILVGILGLTGLFPFQPPVHAGPVTAQALGVGNAYTGVAEGFHALYWNPAGLAVNGYEISAGLGGLGLTGIEDVFQRFEAGTEQALEAGLETFAGVRLGQVAVGTAIEVWTQPGEKDLKWLDWWGIGAGFPITPPEGWRLLSVGMTLRRLVERSVVPGADEFRTESDGEVLDLGVLAVPNPRFRIGVTVRRIWSSYADPEVSDPAESRVGVAYRPEGWKAGIRADLSTEGTLSYGVEWPVGEQGSLSLRLGQEAAPGRDVMTTAGAGLQLGFLHLDLAMGLTRLDPEAARVRADLSIRF